MVVFKAGILEGIPTILYICRKLKENAEFNSICKWRGTCTGHVTGTSFFWFQSHP
jgi:hypothetical protein